ncbi:E3 ubiquitin-protein ligase Os04g0590900-like [Juglans microcarpa x Juglans regia]|uniref:E3 ubiquitin-protein ligase Os04g0590900-like n=1 Tax=Juglans microcarpa x Juglans regia TaxID=2249226 RepID=UPI001B7DC350|nr:E3 ubiquitin-protein ligase Os04g0590900-like [Juglans microcarpa x Juglans regia]
MATLDNPKTWIPYMGSKDCSQGFCTLYCPQWCYIVYPPPPPFEFPDGNSGPNFSPLVIAIISILASAFLLISYYTIISKYCGNGDSARRDDHDLSEESEDNQSHSLHEPWHVVTAGLDEALIKSITVCKYKNGEGLVEGTDCSVCLSEFEEDESIRLLPKCSHAFHLPCIDTWLKSHSNCPLCRANIISFGGTPLPLPAPVTDIPSSNETLPGTQQANENVALAQDLESYVRDEEMVHGDTAPKTSVHAFSDLGNSEERETIIEIRDGGYQHVRRSFSMDLLCQSRPSVADILCMDEDHEDVQVVVEDCVGDSSSSKQLAAGVDEKSSSKSRVLHMVTSPTAMKRSFSSGRFFLTRHGRRRQTVIPV